VTRERVGKHTFSGQDLIGPGARTERLRQAREDRNLAPFTIAQWIPELEFESGTVVTYSRRGGASLDQIEARAAGKHLSATLDHSGRFERTTKEWGVPRQLVMVRRFGSDSRHTR
jgi:hypothetical protein